MAFDLLAAEVMKNDVYGECYLLGRMAELGLVQRERKDYYDQLEATQKGSLDVTPWHVSISGNQTWPGLSDILIATPPLLRTLMAYACITARQNEIDG